MSRLRHHEAHRELEDEREEDADEDDEERVADRGERRTIPIAAATISTVRIGRTSSTRFVPDGSIARNPTPSVGRMHGLATA